VERQAVNAQEQKLVDLSKSYLPLLVVVGGFFVAFQIGSVYRDLSASTTSVEQRFAQVELNRKAELAPIIDSIKNLGTAVDEIRKTLADPTSRAIPTDLLRWQDMYVFCLELERNSQGIKCPLRRKDD
jgi:hypothetical protein